MSSSSPSYKISMGIVLTEPVTATSGLSFTGERLSTSLTYGCRQDSDGPFMLVIMRLWNAVTVLEGYVYMSSILISVAIIKPSKDA